MVVAPVSVFAGVGEFAGVVDGVFDEDVEVEDVVDVD
jgi:hypothetical protein